MTSDLAPTPTAHRAVPAEPTAAAGSSAATVPARVGAIVAVLWSIGFSAVNGWILLAATAPGHVLHDHLVGVAILNGVAIAIKLVAAAAAMQALRGDADPVLAGPATAVLVAAAVTLGAYGLLGLGMVATDGAWLDQATLAGGAMTVTAWTYPAFFLAGAVAFTLPVAHLARRSPRPVRWIALGAVAGPVAAIGTIGVTAGLLMAAGLLPAT